MLLHYVNEEYENKSYVATKDGDFSDWTNVKFTLGLPFPNLPYYIDGDVKLTQSSAILRHLGRKYNLYGESHDQSSQIDMLIDTSTDIRMALALKAYDPDFENLKGKHMEDIKPKFKQVSQFLDSKSFMMGDNLTIADFVMYDAIKWHMALDKDFIGAFGNLGGYIDRLESESKIKAFLASDMAYKAFFLDMATWTGQ